MATTINTPSPEMPVHSATPAMTMEELRAKIGKWLSIPPEDMDIIDFCIAVYFSSYMPGDPLWGMIIDASGGGKTELLRAFRGHCDAYFLSKLTEKSLISGYRDSENPGKDPSLLAELDGKVLIIKDLAPILEMRRETRNKILADLRDAYDGFSDNATGKTGKVPYEARFTFLAACTLAIERFDSVEQELGERTIKFRCRGDGRLAKTKQALRNLGKDVNMREEIHKLFMNFLEQVHISTADIPDSLFDRVALLADFTACARSHVQRDRRGDLQYLPRPEVGTRLAKELGKLLIALAAVRGKSKPDEADFATVQRVAEDCLPPNRLLVIKVLRKEPMQLCEIEQVTKLPRTTIQRVLDDLKVLGIVTGTGDPKNLVWDLATD